MLRRRLQSLWDPCFIFRPAALITACARKLRARPRRAAITTAWGDRFIVDPRRFIGAHLYMRGVHELPVCETLFRLCGKGELALDVGANIGAMTSLLSLAAGPEGHVISFEAHPGILAQLQENVTLWSRQNIELIHAAVSDRPGTLTLSETSGFGQNEGTARIVEAGAGALATADAAAHTVTAVSLDDLIGARRVGLMKIDVEGHELHVLRGASRCLGEHSVRDIVFETGGDYPNATHRLLLEAGYRVSEIRSTWRGPCLVEPLAGPPHMLADCLATLDHDRAARMLAPRGWQVLRPIRARHEAVS